MFGLTSGTWERRRLCLSVAAVIAGSSATALTADAAEVRSAVASNFQKPMEALVAPFKKETGHDLKLSFGSTGNFYAQIINGAPFDVLLAADAATPERLDKEGKAVAGTRFTYAIGRIALWSANANTIKADGVAVLKQGAFQKLAMADPKVAPYGAAAQQSLMKLGLWTMIQPKIVMGQNIAQTQQFAETGNAQLAFLALSQVVDPAMKGRGSYWLVPAEHHDPIEQGAILLLPGSNNGGARALLTFLKGATARKVIEDFGYAMP